jgi:hypothetical protein
MKVTGMSCSSDKIKFCPKCGSKEIKREGTYHGPKGEYLDCKECYLNIYLGLDGRDW